MLLILSHFAYDGVKNLDGPIEDSVTKELLVSCRQAMQDTRAA